ncbi:ABC transporter substrate-binding protein [Rhizobacter sp. Root1221]|uniref:ABC transporter substrate-binding protein n=1 Tax=Rhizobacter sp. Root1221 TaxID=1736433 RepID=UPI0006F710EA|nr:ABC transporter substrate-binding protein [Rhizobacter sp. Root1221]KQW02989.1 amino acid ABC transporter substrate-binding protein [Rhizobacter sp. Root1221]
MNATHFRSLCLFVVASALAATALAGPVLDRVRSSGRVRVCFWPDYYGVSFRNPRTLALTGIDIDLSAEFGADIGVRVEYVESSFGTLVADLTGDRCDVAMFAVGRLPQRMAHLKFTQPYMQSDIYGVTTKGNRVVREWQDIDKPGVMVGVQAGTFMEPVLAESLKRAQLVIVKPPAVRERELEAGRIDVFMTDYPYSRRLLDNADWAVLISPPKPFHVLPYAYAVKPGDDAWLELLDTFVARIKVDGRLARAARAHGLSAIAITK